MSTAPTIAHDLPCRRCRYNLRTLPTDGRCPECGTRVAITLGEKPPPPQPLLDTPAIRRRVALACFALAAVLPAFVVANLIVQTTFHLSGIFWKTDPPYLLGPLSLLFTASIAVICGPQRRVDGTPAFRGLRTITFTLALGAPLAALTWELGYAVAPFRQYDLYMLISDCLAVGAPIAMALTFLLLATLAREWNVPDVPTPLRLFALAWVVTLLRPSQYRSWIPNVADFLPMRDALRHLDGLLQAVWVVTFIESVVLLTCVGVVLSYSAGLRAKAMERAKMGRPVADDECRGELP